MIIINQ